MFTIQEYAHRQLLSGPAKAQFAKFLCNMTGSDIRRMGLMIGIPDENLKLGGGNKFDQCLTLIRIVESIAEDNSEVMKVFAQMFDIATGYTGTGARAAPDIMRLLTREGVTFDNDHPGAVMADVAADEAERKGLGRAEELAKSALDRFSTEPQGAVTAATSFAESACKEALRSVGIEDSRNDFPALLLRLRRETDFEASFGVSERGRNLVRAIASVVESAYALAHEISDRHAGSDEDVGNDVRWLQVSAAMMIGHAVMQKIGQLERRAVAPPAVGTAPKR